MVAVLLERHPLDVPVHHRVHQAVTCLHVGLLQTRVGSLQISHRIPQNDASTGGATEREEPNVSIDNLVTLGFGLPRRMLAASQRWNSRLLNKCMAKGCTLVRMEVEHRVRFQITAQHIGYEYDARYYPNTDQTGWLALERNQHGGSYGYSLGSEAFG